MREGLKQKLRELTEYEHQMRRSGLSVNPYDLGPNGELAIHIGVRYGQRGIRDGKKRRLEESLNRVVETLVSEALDAQKSRAERLRQEQLRHEAEVRQRESDRRTRTEEARRDHFDRLVGHWVRNEERRGFVERLRQAVGAVEPESEIASWLDWADGFVSNADVLEPFGNSSGVLKLYYTGYSSEIAKAKAGGFSDPEPVADRKQRTLTGIALSAARPIESLYSAVLEIELHEGAVLSYEVTEPGYEPRRFVVPARVVNAAMRRNPAVS